jgi:DNA-binding PadR family transcriptional regulator
MVSRMLDSADLRAASVRTATDRGGNPDLLRLLALREIDSASPPTGLEAINGVASIARLLQIAPPGYALLHDLTDDGFLETSVAMPRRYSVTEAGRRESERLAERCRPRLSSELARFTSRLASALPRGPQDLTFATEWTDGADSRDSGPSPPRGDGAPRGNGRDPTPGPRDGATPIPTPSGGTVLARSTPLSRVAVGCVPRIRPRGELPPRGRDPRRR